MKLILLGIFIIVCWFLINLWNETKQTFNDVDDLSEL